MIDTVNFDMDGVLVDLDRTIANLEGYACPLAWFRSLNLKHGDVRNMYHTVIAKHIEKGLFKYAKPSVEIEGFFKLIKHLRENGISTNILSSKMNNELSDEVEKQKIIWLKESGLYDLMNNIYIVHGQEEKPDYSSNSSILIDDMQYTVDIFNKAGLPVIHHKKLSSTVFKLMEMNVIEPDTKFYMESIYQ